MGTPLLWLVFNLFVLAMMALDLGVFHRRPHKLTMRESLTWTLVWIGLSIAFGLGVMHFSGEQRGLEFFTGYVIEKALSVDNLFLFLVIFRAFSVDEKIQHRLLEWGILGALLMRGAMIAAGATRIVECGPGKVLTSLNRRIDKNRDLKMMALEDPKSMDEALANVA